MDVAEKKKDTFVELPDYVPVEFRATHVGELRKALYGTRPAAAADADFGQTDFGHPYLTDFGQADFCPNWCFGLLARPSLHKGRGAGDPFEPAPRRVGPRRVGREGPKNSRFFPSPATINCLSFFPLLVVFSLNFGGV